ncbi:MAG: hypothetical protein HYY85_20895, partial [Deltaproteobacteria bacterium]|nr:hypothetical protein [Deltaproteobacteria bacterium]
ASNCFAYWPANESKAASIPSPVPTRMQQRRPFWMGVNLGLAAVIILLAAYLRRL